MYFPNYDILSIICFVMVLDGTRFPGRTGLEWQTPNLSFWASFKIEQHCCFLLAHHCIRLACLFVGHSLMQFKDPV